MWSRSYRPRFGPSADVRASRHRFTDSRYATLTHERRFCRTDKLPSPVKELLENALDADATSIGTPVTHWYPSGVH